MRAAAAILALGIVGTSVFASGCAELDALWQVKAPTKGKHNAPAVRVASVKLAQAPTQKQLATYYCTKLTKAEMGEFGFVGEAACQAVFGPEPKRKDLQFVFDVDIEAKNASPIPIPVVSLLVAFKAWPDRKGAKLPLGAVCLTLCKDPKNCKQEANACKSSEPEVHDLETFAGAAASFLVSVAVGDKSFDDLKVQTIPPHKDIHFNTRFALDIDQMTKLLGTVASDAIADVKKKKSPKFVIPYAVQGSAWVTIESFGRVGTSIPVVKGQWDLSKI